jgi:hypothetical protein
MTARILDHSTPVYTAPDGNSTIIAELKPEEDFDLGKVTKHRKGKWVAVTLADGRAGFIPGGVRVSIMHDVIVDQADLKVLAAPCADAPVYRHCIKTDRLRHAGPVSRNGAQWIEVRSASGKVGFVQGSASLKPVDDGGLAGAVGSIIFIAVVSVIAGTIGYFTESQTLPGWEAIAGGLIFGVLAYFVHLKSKVALGLAVVLWCLELGFRVIVFFLTSMAEGHKTPPFNVGVLVSLFIGYSLLKSMWAGVAVEMISQ